MRIALFTLGLVLLTTAVVGAEDVPSALTLVPSSNNPAFVASLESTELLGQVEESTLIKIHLEPQEIPFGYYITSLVEIINGPEGSQAEILTGYPVIKVTPKVMGEYQLLVRVNLVIKTSCGGAEATTLLKQPVHFVVSAKKI